MKYKSEPYEVAHQGAVAMYEVGAISDEEMREFDEMCLVKEDETAYESDKTADREPAGSAIRVMEHVTA